MTPIQKRAGRVIPGRLFCFSAYAMSEANTAF